MTVTSTSTRFEVKKSITVETDAENAFKVFTDGIDTWWPRDHHIGGGTMEKILIEPKEGGRCYSTEVEGGECDWGKVLVWDPPHRLVIAWQITSEWQYDTSFITEVEVLFATDGPKRTRVDLEHRYLDRYGDSREPMQAALDSEGGWTGTLRRFAAAAEGRKVE